MPEFHNIFEQKKRKNQKPIEKPLIITDCREKNSLVASELIHLGGEVEFQQLKLGDYIVKNTIVERKTISDFLSSMVNKRLLSQLNDLQNVQSKLLIIEGICEQELYHENSPINENAIRGFLLSILLKYNVPIILTKDYQDTAKFLLVLAKKQQANISLKFSRKSQTPNEQMQFILEGFPGIGPKTAKKLLQHFGSIKKIINAEPEDLEKLIGKKAEFLKITGRAYAV